MSRVHDMAQNGFGKGTNELYDRARPSYPAPALQAIRSAMDSAPPYNVLELGAGTGIFTRAFLAHSEWSSAIRELRAVEPSEGMRAQFSKTIHNPRVSIKDGTFDSTHIPDSWANLIVVVALWIIRIAQAFHWCPDYDKAMAEFNRVLAPRGRVVFIWNLEDADTAWVRQLRNVIEEFEQGTPQYRLGLWRKVFETPSYLKYFEPPEEMTFKHIVKTSLPGVVERAFSKSYIAIQSKESKTHISNELTEIIKKGDDKIWIDEDQGLFEYPYINTVVIMRKE
ncbi:S-adenosyl-L-methionine-dependent methyltransferase [Ramaria rubella]|nr:S-adenosyl-L-methionine-dependent methyltransferase [Ramaria rubella]